ncbi:MAG: diaminopimelate epimerase [Bacillaceae bacterium]|nr:diaminopimelate epimerase [Bacillaceae bacterium]
MKFVKMHGLGNDFIVIGHLDKLPEQVDRMAIDMCDRHFGIGADGLVFVLPSQKADVTMRIMNADGTEAEQCGNAIRCVAKYAYEHKQLRKKQMSVETLAGIQQVWLEIDKKDRVNRIRVDMGRPEILTDSLSGGDVSDPNAIRNSLAVAGKEFEYTPVSMGNPHAVTFVDQADSFQVEKWGPLIEQHEHFPHKTNVEFVTVQSPTEMDMRVWERGVGQTLACGTGACAAAVAGALNRKTERRVLVHLEGGDLLIEWCEQDGHVYMTGPAEEVFVGEWLK